MDSSQGRRLSIEKKVQVEEGRQSKATISEVCWRYEVEHMHRPEPA